MLIFFAALACATPEAEVEAATLVFLSPETGDEPPVGDLACSVVVENFLLVDPAKHGGEDVSEGYISVRVDGAEVLQSGATTFTVTLDAAGAVVLEAELLYDDGDPLDPPALATLDLTVIK